MMKRNQWLMFLYTFLLTFLVLIVTLYSYFYAKHQKKWLMELFTTKMVMVPIIVYVLLIAVVVSGMVMLIMYFVRRQTYGRIEEKLQLLVSGNYDSPLLERQYFNDTDNEYLMQIEQAITDIRVKMTSMSKDLQYYSKQPQMVDGESKEDILQAERHRLARELHDSVSQQLFAATMMLSALNEAAEDSDIPEPLRKQLEMVGSIINTSQSEMRALLLHLRPINLEGKSLKQGIKQLLVELQSKINIKLIWDIEDVHLESGIEDHLFRIVQELLSNALRHAKASTLEVYLNRVENIVLLRVVDDGIGFDMTQKKVGSYGLNNIGERVTGMGGTHRIVSFKGQGTSVEIKVPVIGENGEND